MTDPITTVTEPTPASPTPAAPPVDVAALIQQLNQASDARIAGLMSTYDKKFNTLQSELRKSQRIGVADETDDPRISELEAEVARAQRDAAMARAAGKYPDAYPLFEQIVSIEDPEAQLAALDTFVKQQRAATQPEPAAAVQAEPETPDFTPQVSATPAVDPNNPPRQQASGGPVYSIAGKDVVMDKNNIQRALGFLPKQLQGR